MDPEPVRDSPHPRRLANPDAARPKHPKKDWDTLLHAAWEQGAWIETTKKGTIRVYPPDQRGEILTIHMTNSDYRSLANARSAFRRSGLNV